MNAPTPPATGPGSVRSWTVPLHGYTRPPLSLNDRMHHMKRHRITQGFKNDVINLLRVAKVPKGLDRVTVVLHYAPRTKGRRDHDNLIATVKPICDAMVAAKVITDDDSVHVTLSPPVVHPATGEPGRVWFVVIDLSTSPT